MDRNRLVRLDRPVQLAAAILFVCCMVGAEIARAHTHYITHMSPEVIDPSRTSSAHGSFEGYFGDPSEPPPCGDEMHFNWSSANLEGEAVSLSFRIGGTEGTLYRRVAASARSVEMDAAVCEIFDAIDDDGSGMFETDLFIVLETTQYPDGEIGGELIQMWSQPTLDATWGSIKSLYRE